MDVACVGCRCVVVVTCSCSPTDVGVIHNFINNEAGHSFTGTKFFCGAAGWISMQTQREMFSLQEFSHMNTNVYPIFFSHFFFHHYCNIAKQ